MNRKKLAPRKSRAPLAKAGPLPVEHAFGDVLHLLQAARQRAYQAANAELEIPARHSGHLAEHVADAQIPRHLPISANFKDTYTLEFLGLPTEHSGADLHAGLLRNLGRFITELGRDFCYIGSEQWLIHGCSFLSSHPYGVFLNGSTRASLP